MIICYEYYGGSEICQHQKHNKKLLVNIWKKKYDEIKIRMPKGHKAEIKAHADTQKESVNGFINRAIDETMKRDNDLKSNV